MENTLVAHGIMCDTFRMHIELKHDVVNLTDFARNTKQHTKELAEGGRPRILTQNGRAAAVVLSPEAFEKMAGEAEEYRMDQRLRKALESYAAGNTGTPAGKVIGRIRKRVQLRRKQAE